MYYYSCSFIHLQAISSARPVGEVDSPYFKAAQLVSLVPSPWKHVCGHGATGKSCTSAMQTPPPYNSIRSSLFCEGEVFWYMFGNLYRMEENEMTRRIWKNRFYTTAPYKIEVRGKTKEWSVKGWAVWTGLCGDTYAIGLFKGVLRNRW